MLYEKAEKIVDTNLKRVSELDPSLSDLTKHISVDFEATNSGDSNSKTGVINLGTQHQHVSRATGIPEEILMSYVLYHEVGHQMLPWLRANPLERNDLMNEFFSKDYKDAEDVQSFIERKGIQFFNDSKLQDFHDKLLFSEFENCSAPTHELLTNFAFKQVSIYHEQYAECFALYMIKKQFPKDFEKFAEVIIQNRKEEDYFYRNYRDDKMDEQRLGDIPNIGFVHCLHKITEDYSDKLKHSPKFYFQTFSKDIFPMLDNYCAMEMKHSMDSQKLAAFFPKELMDLTVISSPDMNPDKTIGIRNKIKSIRSTMEVESNPLNSATKKL